MSKRIKVTDQDRAGESQQATDQTTQVPLCAKCQKPVILLDGDNGCGTRTEHGATVTNCVPVKLLNG